MISAGIRDVKNNFSHYLRTVQQGHEVLITDRGRPVARIVREATRKPSFRERLSSLVEKGLVELPLRQERKITGKPLSLPGKSLSEMILEDRR